MTQQNLFGKAAKDMTVMVVKVTDDVIPEPPKKQSTLDSPNGHAKGGNSHEKRVGNPAEQSQEGRNFPIKPDRDRPYWEEKNPDEYTLKLTPEEREKVMKWPNR